MVIDYFNYSLEYFTYERTSKSISGWNGLHNATEVLQLLISVGFHSVRNTKQKGSSTYRWAGIFALKKGIYRIYSRNSVPLRYKKNRATPTCWQNIFGKPAGSYRWFLAKGGWNFEQRDWKKIHDQRFWSYIFLKMHPKIYS